MVPRRGAGAPKVDHYKEGRVDFSGGRGWGFFASHYCWYILLFYRRYRRIAIHFRGGGKQHSTWPQGPPGRGPGWGGGGPRRTPTPRWGGGVWDISPPPSPTPAKMPFPEVPAWPPDRPGCSPRMVYMADCAMFMTEGSQSTTSNNARGAPAKGRQWIVRDYQKEGPPGHRFGSKLQSSGATF